MVVQQGSEASVVYGKELKKLCCRGSGADIVDDQQGRVGAGE